jgi:hypothetical protein
MATTASIIAATLQAIETITLHGQSYSIDGRVLTRADLPALHRQLAFFEARQNAEAGRSRETQARFQRPV